MHLALAGLLTVLAAVPATAETGRYQFERTEAGIVRLDTETGAVALCSGDPLQCRESGNGTPVADSDIERIEQRLAALERRIAALEKDGSGDALPSEEEFDRTLSLMERFMRRFFGVIQEFGDTPETPPPPAPPPGRT